MHLLHLIGTSSKFISLALKNRFSNVS